MDFLIPANSTKIIKESNAPFSQILFVQGWAGDAFGSYVLSGYGSGTSARNHVSSIGDGGIAVITVDGMEFIVKNTYTSELYCSVLCVMGRAPVIM